MMSSKLILFVIAFVATASAFSSSPAFASTRSTRLAGQTTGWEDAKELGWSMGGQDHTRNPEVKDDEDPRKSVRAAPSFEEYMKQRAGQGN